MNFDILDLACLRTAMDNYVHTLELTQRLLSPDVQRSMNGRIEMFRRLRAKLETAIAERSAA